MIPKIIHYCWLSGDPFPPNIKKCIDSWHVFLPDYELRLWSKDTFDMDSFPWVKQAYDVKKYAFAADYIRFYAVYNYGGIYLDSDVEVLKTFNDLLDLPYFVGAESTKTIEAAAFGAEKGMQWVKDCLLHYNNRSFVKQNGTFDVVTAPNVMKEGIEKTLSIKMMAKLDKEYMHLHINSELCVLPNDFFSCKDYTTGIIRTTINSYCVHNFVGKWLNPFSMMGFRHKFKILLIRIFGEGLIVSLSDIITLRIFKRKMN